MWKWTFPTKQEVIEYKSRFHNIDPIWKNNKEKRNYIIEEISILENKPKHLKSWYENNQLKCLYKMI